MAFEVLLREWLSILLFTLNGNVEIAIVFALNSELVFDIEFVLDGTILVIENVLFLIGELLVIDIVCCRVGEFAVEAVFILGDFIEVSRDILRCRIRDTCFIISWSILSGDGDNGVTVIVELRVKDRFIAGDFCREYNWDCGWLEFVVNGFRCTANVPRKPARRRMVSISSKKKIKSLFNNYQTKMSDIFN